MKIELINHPELTEEDYGFILSSLNETFNNCAKKLETPDKLGTIEKGITEQTKEIAYALICKIEKISGSFL